MFGTLIAGATAGMLMGQVVGGFISSKYPLCSGQESTLSVCSMETRSEGQGECAHNKALVRCYMISVDTNTCGISTESSSTVTGSATIGEPSSTTTPETVDHTASTVHSTGTVTPSSSEHITSTRQTETNQQNQKNPNNNIIIIGACAGGVLIVIIVAVICVLFACVVTRGLRARKDKNIVSPDSPVKVRKSDETTDSKDLESRMYSELNNRTTVVHVPIYDTVNKSQNLSEVSASDSIEENHTYASLDQEGIYSQIAPHLGATNKSSTLPAGLTSMEASLYYHTLDHSRSLPRSTGPPTSAAYILTHAVNRTALELESGTIKEKDLVSPTQSEMSGKFPSPRGSPKQHHSSSQSSTSKEEAPLIISDPTNAQIENYYHVLDRDVTTSSAEQDIVSQISTDAVCNQQMMDNNEDRHAQCPVDRQVGGAVYSTVDPTPRAQLTPPSRHESRQRSQTTVKNKSPPHQHRMRSNSAKRVDVRGGVTGMDYSSHRVVTPNNSMSQLMGSGGEINDPQMNTLV